MLDLLYHAPRVFRHRGSPLQLIFFITARCNLRCSHCFYAGRLNGPGPELSLDEIEKISRGMGRLLWFAMTGGEPFLREDIAQIAEIFRRNNRARILTITTNGLLAEPILRHVPEICRSYAGANVVLYVSVDGLEETHDRIRGVSGGFKKAIGTVRELKGLKKYHGNLSVATVTTCTAENQAELKALAIFLKDDVRPDSVTINMIRGKPCSGPLGAIDIRHYFDFIEVRQAGWAAGDLRHFDFFGGALLRKKETLQKEIIAAVLKEKRCVLPCLAGNISCVMDETGDLYPCEVLGRKIGSLREEGYDFRKVWHSAEAEKIRSYIKDTGCYCTYECAITTNILFNIRQLVKMSLR